LHRRPLRHHQRAVSPILGGLVLTVVGITLAFMVFNWADSITQAALKQSDIQLTSYILPTSSWDVYIKVKNTGSTSTKLVEVFINGRPIGENGALNWSPQDPAVEPITVDSGSTTGITFRLEDNSEPLYVNGQFVEIELVFKDGRKYLAVVILP